MGRWDDSRVPLAFGLCLSESNTTGQEMQTSHAEDLLPFEGASFPISGKACTPALTRKWLDPKEDTLVDGKPALTVKCTLCCTTGGGVIAFADDGQGV